MGGSGDVSHWALGIHHARMGLVNWEKPNGHSNLWSGGPLGVKAERKETGAHVWVGGGGGGKTCVAYRAV